MKNYEKNNLYDVSNRHEKSDLSRRFETYDFILNHSNIVAHKFLRNSFLLSYQLDSCLILDEKVVVLNHDVQQIYLFSYL